ncbi:PH domain-containing protein [Saccharopolyspora griseoalba]|uniref:PH domain-containing protein n=1 Tax=Saccharopolyspora griseoalba TaxID=1431848 RepID=A0ABW2LEH6_9PSEU
MSETSPEAGQAAPEPTESAAEQASAPRSLTFRVTRVHLVFVAALIMFITPVATMAGGPWLLLYLIPLVLAWWVIRTGTTVDAEQVRARTALGSTRFGWDELSSLRLHENRWIKAVLTSGKEVRLPAVRVRDLPGLAAISGGRLTDPTSQE